MGRTVVPMEGVQDTRGANQLEHVVSPLVQPAKNVKIQSAEHVLLLKMIPNATMYGPEVNLV